jgi:hypothetical protein
MRFKKIRCDDIYLVTSRLRSVCSIDVVMYAVCYWWECGTERDGVFDGLMAVESGDGAIKLDGG